ncbi:MAG TPA: hypothetical protein VKB95_00855 [Chitinophagaceae bacterium]|nr:hypothetical protein [Chitinophagaceae bacterium]
MKTILTFAAGLLLTLSTMAADHRPTVTIKSRRNFEIVVDGRLYHNDNTIRLDMFRGVHTIKVYERGRGFFGRPQLVSAKNFFVRNNDLRIIVDYSGYVDIDERGYNGRGYDRNDRRWDGNDRDRDWNDRGLNGNDRDRNDRTYDRNGY